MIKHAPATLVSTALSKWNDYSERDFLLNIGRWNIPSHLHNDLETQLDKDRLSLLPWWGDRQAPWVSIEERLALAAKRNDLEEVASLLSQLEENHRVVNRLLIHHGLRPLLFLTDPQAIALTEAAGNNHLALVQLLLGLGAGRPSLNSMEGPLEVAAQAGHLEVVRLLLLKLGRWEVPRALAKAVKSGQLPAVKLLLKWSGPSSLGPELTQAIKSGHPEIVHLLLEHGVKGTVVINYQAVLANQLILDDLLRHNILNLQDLSAAAIAKGDHDLAQQLIDHHGAIPNNDRIMQEVAVTGNMEVFHDLLNRGVQPSMAVLEMAAYRGHLAMVRELLSKVVGDTSEAAKHAAIVGHLAIVQELFDRTSNPGYVLMYAAKGGHAETVEWLIANYIRKHQLDEEALGLAAVNAWSHSHPAIAERLVKLFSDKRNKNYALITAAKHGHLEMVRWLLANGAPVNVPEEPSSALEEAAEHNHGEIAQLLIDNGAHISPKAIDNAASNGHLTLALLLLEHETSLHD